MSLTNTFKNSGTVLSTSNGTLYSCPTGAQAIVQSVYISNTSSTQDITVSVTMYNVGSGSSTTFVSNVGVPIGNTLILDKPINMQAGDILQIKASQSNISQALASILEMT